MTDRPKSIVLASASRARRTLLENAGVPFTVCVSDVDEDVLKNSQDLANAVAEDLAFALADAKAKDVLDRLSSSDDVVVIGADQILVCNGVRFDKPRTMAEAADHLGQLNGKTHQLISACSIRQGEAPAWRCIETAQLRMRTLSPGTIDRYLETIGEAALHTVGCYQLEGIGAHLFERVDGDYFTILGLPLLPILSYLRLQKVIPE